jgi:hypothetical protein
LRVDVRANNILGTAGECAIRGIKGRVHNVKSFTIATSTTIFSIVRRIEKVTNLVRNNEHVIEQLGT